MRDYLRLLFASLIVFSAALGQDTRSDSATPASAARKPGAASVKRTANKVSNVVWSDGSDKFTGKTWAGMTLRNISSAHPLYSMTFLWQSSVKSPSHRWYAIGFGDSLDPLKGTFPQTEGILLLNGEDRIYLTGSPKCKAVSCNQPNVVNDFAPWVVVDLASATSVEGRVDGIEFSLKSDHLAAIKEFESRFIDAYSDSLLKKFEGKTAQEAAIDLRRLSGIDDHVSPYFTITDLKVDSLSAESFSFSYATRNADSKVTNLNEEMKLSDLALYEATSLSCRDSDCVSYSGGDDDVRTRKHLAGDILPVILGRDNSALLAYIYYRVMYRGDRL